MDGWISSVASLVDRVKEVSVGLSCPGGWQRVSRVHVTAGGNQGSCNMFIRTTAERQRVHVAVGVAEGLAGCRHFVPSIVPAGG